MTDKAKLFRLFFEKCETTLGGKRWYCYIYPKGEAGVVERTVSTELHTTAERAIAAAIRLGAMPDENRQPR